MKNRLAAFIASLPLQAIFQRFPGILLICVVPFCVLAPIHFPLQYFFSHLIYKRFALYYVSLHCLFLVNNVRSAYGMYVAYGSAKKHSSTDFLELYCAATGAQDGSDLTHDLPYDHVVHVILLPNYKETMETMCETLDVLASHTRAITQKYSICLAMEETEPDCKEKALKLIRYFGDSFYKMTYTIHPAGLDGEIRGKSSNVAYAAVQMATQSGGGIQGRHEHEIVTVMDADTCFAADYFTAVTYHYCVALPEQRRIMMFAPSTVFDRNANDVPVFVRVTDMFWSIGVMSNLYDNSPVKIPCSAYSLSMDLAVSVDFWDTGPEAIGEDMHQYLKCFFATQGHVIVKSIYSPASQCNIEGEGSGIKGYMSGLNARFIQAKRHLWGSLDTGYSLRKTVLSLVAPLAQQTVHLKNTHIDKLGKVRNPSMPLYTLLTLFHRLFEAHVIMSQLFIVILIGTFLFPITGSINYGSSAYAWSLFSTSPLPEQVSTAVELCFYIRLFSLIPNILMITMYERYLQWVGFERWALQERMLALPEHKFAYPKSNGHLGILKNTHKEAFTCKIEHEGIIVQHLGKRASLASPRLHPWCLLDWVAIPVSGFLFYFAPLCCAQLTHLFTSKLDYKVAAKPQLVSSCYGSMERVSDDFDVKSTGRDEGFFEEDESRLQSPSMSRSGSGMSDMLMVK